MRYTLHGGAKKKKRRWPALLIAAVLLLGGAYLLYNTLSPMLPDYTGDSQATAKKLSVSQPVVSENRIYMPQINVDIPIVEIQGDEEAALDKGAVHRAPSSGNPKDGGNYVLAAHRFTLGITPAQTRAKSPFYHIDQMQVGDQVYVDYSGVRYAYKIAKKETVAATDVAIEDKTADPQLTVYSCGLSGSRDGREVLLAKFLGVVTWENGQAKIQTTSD
jgi:sortase A